MRVFLFALVSVLAVALTTLAQQGPEENECALFPEAGGEKDHAFTLRVTDRAGDSLTRRFRLRVRSEGEPK